MASEDTVYDFLVASGLGPAGAAGVVGNLQGESQLNPGAVGDNGTSHGIAQWHNDRWTAFVNWASRAGKDPNALSTQSSYLVSDLKDKGLWDQLSKVTTPGDAVSIMVKSYEKPLDPNGAIATRTPLANAILAKDEPGIWDRIKGYASDPEKLVTDPLSAARQAVADGFGAAANAVVGAAEPIAVKVAFVGLGLGLIAMGGFAIARPVSGKAEIGG